MAEGRSNGAIAESLTLTTKAVVRHVSHIYNTLGLEPADEDHRRVLAVVAVFVGLRVRGRGSWRPKLKGTRPSEAGARS